MLGEPNQPLHFSHIYSVSLSACLSQITTVLDKDQERENLCEPCECGDDEGVLEAHVGNLRCDATTFLSMEGMRIREKRGGSPPVSNRKTHRVPDENHRDNRFTAEFPIRINTLAYRDDCTKGVRETDDTHREHDAKPMNAVRGSHTPKDQTSRDQKSG